MAVKKIRFTGKGYKIRKSRRSLAYKLNFGLSHKTVAVCGGLATRKTAKHRVFIASNISKVANRGAALIVAVRKPNPYTKRGLRGGRHLMIKRPGKKTNY